jgi:formate-dependent nitrite reductase membrane component NrfD
MTELDVARHAPILDPALQVWGWEIPAYLFLGGVAAGVMIVSALVPLRSRNARWLAAAPPVLVSLGMLALFLDLARKAHLFRFYLALRPASPMSWGAWILVFVYPVTALVALGALDEATFARLPLASRLARVRAFALGRAAFLRRASLALGVALGLYTGILLSTLGARALWASALLGPLFLASAVSTGAAFLLLFGLSDDERHAIARLDLAAMGVEAVLLALFLAGLATGGAPGRTALAQLAGGPWTAPFWGLVAFAGLALPASLELLHRRLALPFTRAVPALVLCGGLALRAILVAAGQQG